MIPLAAIGVEGEEPSSSMGHFPSVRAKAEPGGMGGEKDGGEQ